ncbi:uncharacterized protein LOC128382757, partial [Scomber scombrus]
FSDSEGSLVTWSGYQKMVGCVEEKSKSESPASTFESKHPPPDISDEAGPSHIKEENTPNRATPDGHEGDGSNLSSHPSTSNTTLNVSEDSRDDEEEGFRPNMLTESDNISYRFSCPGPGVFRCNLTGLMFVMTKKAELQYWTVQWDERVLQPAGKTAAGPLFNIQSSPEGAVSQLHLPHCETMDAPLPEGLLSVVHITDDGMSILKLLHITDTHVVVKVLHLSAFGLVTNDEYRNTANRSVNGQVLLFLQKPQSETQKQYLDVFLLPRNVPLSEVIARHQDVDYIKAPPRCQLIVGESYSVDCPEAALIQPDKAVFDLEFEPNYHPMFEIRLPTNKDKMTLKVQDQTNPEVWKYEMDLKAPRRRHLKRNLPAKVLVQQTLSVPAETPNVLADEKLKSVRTQFIERVTDSNLNTLLGKLLDQRIINDGEMESAENPIRAKKAGALIDMVRKKGPEACSALITALCEVDPFLSKLLNLQ